jgi:hypothetical protein
VSKGKARLIVRGETEADLFDRDVDFHPVTPAGKE